MDDAASIKLEQDDLAFADKLRQAMSDFYPKEVKCEKKVVEVFLRFKVAFNGQKVPGMNFVMDHCYIVNGHACCLGETKCELCSGGGECSLQSISYYLELTRVKALEYVNSNLLCLIVLVFGKRDALYMCFVSQ